MTRGGDVMGGSIGIIGGADGPTAIYISGGAEPWIVLGIAAALIVGIMIHRKRKH